MRRQVESGNGGMEHVGPCSSYKSLGFSLVSGRILYRGMTLSDYLSCVLKGSLMTDCSGKTVGGYHNPVNNYGVKDNGSWEDDDNYLGYSCSLKANLTDRRV